MQQAYYVAGKQVSRQLEAYSQDVRDKRKKANALSRRIGATKALWRSHGFVGDVLVGFQFPVEEYATRHGPDKADWCPLRGTNGGFRPRRNRRNAALLKEMDALQYELSGAIARIVKIPPSKCIRAIEGGISFVGAGCEFVADRWIITVATDVRPKGCRRIADIAYERLKRKARTGD